MLPAVINSYLSSASAELELMRHTWLNVKYGSHVPTMCGRSLRQHGLLPRLSGLNNVLFVKMGHSVST